MSRRHRSCDLREHGWASANAASGNVSTVYGGHEKAAATEFGVEG